MKGENIMNEIKTVQYNLVYIRKILGLSQEDFGQIIGKTRQTIYNYETGKRSINKLVYIAIKMVVKNCRLINPDISEEEYQFLQKLLYKKVDKINYIRSLEFEEFD